MLRTHQLSFSYPRGERLEFSDILISEGEHTLIIGPSGCGKTTLLHLLAGLRSPATGTIEILGQDITKMPKAQLDQYRGQKIGMIFQTPHFVKSLSVLDNLHLARYLAGQKEESQKAMTLLQGLNLGKKAKKKTQQLSVGEQQRVAICRAMMNDPKIIFADEPTSALDDHNTCQVINLLKEQAEQRGATLIVVTHDQRLKDHFQNRIEL